MDNELSEGNGDFVILSPKARTASKSSSRRESTATKTPKSAKSSKSLKSAKSGKSGGSKKNKKKVDKSIDGLEIPDISDSTSQKSPSRGTSKRASIKFEDEALDELKSSKSPKSSKSSKSLKSSKSSKSLKSSKSSKSLKSSKSSKSLKSSKSSKSLSEKASQSIKSLGKKSSSRKSTKKDDFSESDMEESETLPNSQFEADAMDKLRRLKADLGYVDLDQDDDSLDPFDTDKEMEPLINPHDSSAKDIELGGSRLGGMDLGASHTSFRSQEDEMTALLEFEHEKLKTDVDYLQLRMSEIECRQAEFADLEGLQETVFNEIESFRDRMEDLDALKKDLKALKKRPLPPPPPPPLPPPPPPPPPPQNASEQGSGSTRLLEDETDDDDDEEDGTGKKNKPKKGDIDQDVVNWTSFPHDTYSFMIVCPVLTTPFALAILVYCVQIFAFLSVAISITEAVGDTDSKRVFNAVPISVPTNVEASVKVIQILALAIAVVTQDGIRTAMSILCEGYDKEKMAEYFPHISMTKWIFSILFRFCEGTIGLIVTFLLIITSEDVVGLLLSFMAMEFISLLDEAIFILANQGYLGMGNLIHAKAVVETRVFVDHRGHSFSLNVVQAVIFMVFLGLWGYVLYFQVSGRLLCNVIFVQFDDEVSPSLGTYSGVYDRMPGRIFGWPIRRITYRDRRSERAMIGYCPELNSWTFSANGAIDGDFCNWQARSSETGVYDVLETSTTDWLVRDSTESLTQLPMNNFYMACYDCDASSTTFTSSLGLATHNQNNCGGRGTCTAGACSCEEGWFGLRCEFPDPCPTLSIDEQFAGFRGEARSWSDEYQTVELASGNIIYVYDRPLYVNRYEDNFFDIIFFTGRRWVATTSDSLPIVMGEDGLTEIATFFLYQFHASWTNYSVSFISEPVDTVDTVSTADSSFEDGTPVGVRWFNAEPKINNTIQAVENDRELETVLLCAVCDDVLNPCLYDGECGAGGSCRCALGSLGTLCQIAPIGNGHCDAFYNRQEFQFDGGDCCESTCVSSEEFRCGTDRTGFESFGYPLCHLTAEEWRPNGGSFEGERFTLSGTSVAISGNGELLAFGEPGADRVRLFDKDGSDWVERRTPLLGPSSSGFGIAVAMSINTIGMVNNPRSLIPAIIAVAAPRRGRDGGAFVRVYRCFTLRCAQIGSDLTGFGENDKLVLDVSNDGNVVAIGALRVIIDNVSPVVVFGRDSDSDVWTERTFEWPETIGQLQEYEFLSALSLSGNGETLAVRSWTYTQTADLSSSIREEDRNRIYAWNGNGTGWRPKGDPLFNRISEGSSAAGNGRGRSIDLTDDGNTIVIGSIASSGERGVRVFDWAPVPIREWTARGRSMNSGLPILDLGQEGWTVAISADGMVVAFGSGIVGEAETSLHVYRNSGLNWERLGLPLPAGEGYDTSIALSVDGSVLAVGLPQPTSDFTDTGGLTVAYGFPDGERCPIGSTPLRLSLTTDNHPGDTTWEITFGSGVGVGGGPFVYGYPVADYWPSFSTFVSETCIVPSLCTVFTVYDKVNFRQNAANNEVPDGMIDPAGYSLFLDGERIASGKVQEAVERVHIGNCLVCEGGSQLLQMMIHTCVPLSWELRDGGTVLFSGSNSDQFTSGLEFDCSSQVSYWEEVCVDELGCYDFTIRIPRVHSWLSNIKNEDLFQYRLFLDNEEIEEQVVSIPNSFLPTESLASTRIGGCGTSRHEL